LKGQPGNFEALEGGRAAKNFFEFLPKGKLRVGGDEQAGTVWKQIGGRVVMDIVDANGTAHFAE
jgi:hypothetical protein